MSMDMRPLALQEELAEAGPVAMPEKTGGSRPATRATTFKASPGVLPPKPPKSLETFLPALPRPRQPIVQAVHSRSSWLRSLLALSQRERGFKARRFQRFQSVGEIAGLSECSAYLNLQSKFGAQVQSQITTTQLALKRLNIR